MTNPSNIKEEPPHGSSKFSLNDSNSTEKLQGMSHPDKSTLPMSGLDRREESNTIRQHSHRVDEAIRSMSLQPNMAQNVSWYSPHTHKQDNLPIPSGRIPVSGENGLFRNRAMDDLAGGRTKATVFPPPEMTSRLLHQRGSFHPKNARTEGLWGRPSTQEAQERKSSVESVWSQQDRVTKAGACLGRAAAGRLNPEAGKALPEILGFSGWGSGKNPEAPIDDESFLLWEVERLRRKWDNHKAALAQMKQRDSQIRHEDVPYRRWLHDRSTEEDRVNPVATTAAFRRQRDLDPRMRQRSRSRDRHRSQSRDRRLLQCGIDERKAMADAVRQPRSPQLRNYNQPETDGHAMADQINLTAYERENVTRDPYAEFSLEDCHVAGKQDDPNSYLNPLADNGPNAVSNASMNSNQGSTHPNAQIIQNSNQPPRSSVPPRDSSRGPARSANANNMNWPAGDVEVEAKTILVVMRRLPLTVKLTQYTSAYGDKIPAGVSEKSAVSSSGKPKHPGSARMGRMDNRAGRGADLPQWEKRGRCLAEELDAADVEWEDIAPFSSFAAVGSDNPAFLASGRTAPSKLDPEKRPVKTSAVSANIPRRDPSALGGNEQRHTGERKSAVDSRHKDLDVAVDENGPREDATQQEIAEIDEAARHLETRIEILPKCESPERTPASPELTAESPNLSMRVSFHESQASPNHNCDEQDANGSIQSVPSFAELRNTETGNRAGEPSVTSGSPCPTIAPVTSIGTEVSGPYQRQYRWRIIRSRFGLDFQTALSENGKHRVILIGDAGVDVSKISPVKSEQEMLSRRLEAFLMSKDMVPVWLSAGAKQERFAQELLYPLFHFRTPPIGTGFSYLDWPGYMELNKSFAERVNHVFSEDDWVIVYSYHFMILPEMLRQFKAMRNALISFYLPTVFPSSEMYRILPQREELLRGVLHADLIAFHSHNPKKHFFNACTRILAVECSSSKIEPCAESGGKGVRIAAVPQGIPTEPCRILLESPQITKVVEVLRQKFRRKKVLLGVDCLDYTQGIPQKLMAFRKLLTNHPQWANKLVFIQLCFMGKKPGIDATYTSVNKNSHIDQKDILTQAFQVSGYINSAFGTLDHLPVHLLVGNFTVNELIPIYATAHVGVMTGLREALCTPAYHFIVCQDKYNKGVLVLSEFSASAQLLGAAALSVNPWDITSFAKTLHDALTMSDDERVERHECALESVTKLDANSWGHQLLLECNEALQDSVTERIEIPRVLSMNPFVNTMARASHKIIVLGLRDCIMPNPTNILDPEVYVDDTDVLEDPMGNIRATDWAKTIGRANSFSYSSQSSVVCLPPEIVSVLNVLTEDSSNTIIVISSSSRNFVEDVLSPCPKVWALAENGHFIKAPNSAQFEPFDYFEEPHKDPLDGRHGHRIWNYTKIGQSNTTCPSGIRNVSSMADASSINDDGLLLIPKSANSTHHTSLDKQTDNRHLSPTVNPASGPTMRHGSIRHPSEDTMSSNPHLVSTAKDNSNTEEKPDSVGQSAVQNYPWQPPVEELFKYFTSRTPGSYIRKTTTTLSWYYGSKEWDFSSMQAKDLLIHLWAGILASHEDVDVAVGGNSIEVRSCKVTKSMAVERIIWRTLSEFDLNISDVGFLIIGNMLPKDEDVFQIPAKLHSQFQQQLNSIATAPGSLLVAPGAPNLFDSSPCQTERPQDKLFNDSMRVNDSSHINLLTAGPSQNQPCPGVCSGTTVAGGLLATTPGSSQRPKLPFSSPKSKEHPGSLIYTCTVGLKPSKAEFRLNASDIGRVLRAMMDDVPTLNRLRRERTDSADEKTEPLEDKMADKEDKMASGFGQRLRSGSYSFANRPWFNKQTETSDVSMRDYIRNNNDIVFRPPALATVEVDARDTDGEYYKFKQFFKGPDSLMANIAKTTRHHHLLSQARVPSHSEEEPTEVSRHAGVQLHSVSRYDKNDQMFESNNTRRSSQRNEQLGPSSTVMPSLFNHPSVSRQVGMRPDFNILGTKVGARSGIASGAESVVQQDHRYVGDVDPEDVEDDEDEEVDDDDEYDEEDDDDDDEEKEQDDYYYRVLRMNQTLNAPDGIPFSHLRPRTIQNIRRPNIQTVNDSPTAWAGFPGDAREQRPLEDTYGNYRIKETGSRMAPAFDAPHFSGSENGVVMDFNPLQVYDGRTQYLCNPHATTATSSPDPRPPQDRQNPQHKFLASKNEIHPGGAEGIESTTSVHTSSSGSRIPNGEIRGSDNSLGVSFGSLLENDNGSSLDPRRRTGPENRKYPQSENKDAKQS